MAWVPETENIYFDSFDFISSVPISFANLGMKKVSKIFCNINICHVITEEGNVYSWGNDREKYGVLGMGDGYYFTSPVLNKNFGGKKIIDLSIGEKHAAAIDDGHSLYSWGTQKYGECGYEDGINKSNIPINVSVKNLYPLKVKCGYTYTMIMDYDNSSKYFGVICDKSVIEDNIDKIEPNLHCVPFDQSLNIRINDIYCGNSMIAIIDTNYNLFLFSDYEGLYYVRLPFGVNGVKFVYNSIYASVNGSQYLYEFAPLKGEAILENYVENLFKIDKTVKSISVIDTPYYDNVLFFNLECDKDVKKQGENQINLMKLVKDNLNPNFGLNTQEDDYSTGRFNSSCSSFTSLLNTNLNIHTINSNSISYFNKTLSQRQTIINGANSFASLTNSLNSSSGYESNKKPSTRISRISSLLGRLFNKKIDIINNHCYVERSGSGYLFLNKKRIDLELLAPGWYTPKDTKQINGFHQRSASSVPGGDFENKANSKMHFRSLSTEKRLIDVNRVLLRDNKNMNSFRKSIKKVLGISSNNENSLNKADNNEKHFTVNKENEKKSLILEKRENSLKDILVESKEKQNNDKKEFISVDKIMKKSKNRSNNNLISPLTSDNDMVQMDATQINKRYSTMERYESNSDMNTIPNSKDKNNLENIINISNKKISIERKLIKTEELGGCQREENVKQEASFELYIKENLNYPSEENRNEFEAVLEKIQEEKKIPKKSHKKKEKKEEEKVTNKRINKKSKNDNEVLLGECNLIRNAGGVLDKRKSYNWNYNVPDNKKIIIKEKKENNITNSKEIKESKDNLEPIQENKLVNKSELEQKENILVNNITKEKDFNSLLINDQSCSKEKNETDNSDPKDKDHNNHQMGHNIINKKDDPLIYQLNEQKVNGFYKPSNNFIKSEEHFTQNQPNQDNNFHKDNINHQELPNTNNNSSKDIKFMSSNEIEKKVKQEDSNKNNNNLQISSKEEFILSNNEIPPKILTKNILCQSPSKEKDINISIINQDTSENGSQTFPISITKIFSLNQTNKPLYFSTKEENELSLIVSKFELYQQNMQKTIFEKKKPKIQNGKDSSLIEDNLSGSVITPSEPSNQLISINSVNTYLLNDTPLQLSSTSNLISDSNSKKKVKNKLIKSKNFTYTISCDKPLGINYNNYNTNSQQNHNNKINITENKKVSFKEENISKLTIPGSNSMTISPKYEIERINLNINNQQTRTNLVQTPKKIIDNSSIYSNLISMSENNKKESKEFKKDFSTNSHMNLNNNIHRVESFKKNKPVSSTYKQGGNNNQKEKLNKFLISSNTDRASPLSQQSPKSPNKLMSKKTSASTFLSSQFNPSLLLDPSRPKTALPKRLVQKQKPRKIIEKIKNKRNSSLSQSTNNNTSNNISFPIHMRQRSASQLTSPQSAYPFGSANPSHKHTTSSIGVQTNKRIASLRENYIGYYEKVFGNSENKIISELLSPKDEDEAKKIIDCIDNTNDMNTILSGVSNDSEAKSFREIKNDLKKYVINNKQKYHNNYEKNEFEPIATYSDTNKLLSLEYSVNSSYMGEPLELERSIWTNSSLNTNTNNNNSQIMDKKLNHIQSARLVGCKNII